MNELDKKCKELQDRIDSAIQKINQYESIIGYYDYIEEYGYTETTSHNTLQEELLDILKGEDLEKELDQYKNNWEELKKWLNTKIIDYKKYDIDDFAIYQYVLNKMKELEEDK